MPKISPADEQDARRVVRALAAFAVWMICFAVGASLAVSLLREIAHGQ